MKLFLSVHWVLVASLWYFANGLFHDIFVIRGHKGGYNRELLRLLMDGHVLLLTGILTFISYLMMLNKIQYGAFINIALGFLMLVYCGMIFPFLKSFGTMAVSVWLIIVSIYTMESFPNIFEIMEKYK